MYNFLYLSLVYNDLVTNKQLGSEHGTKSTDVILPSQPSEVNIKLYKFSDKQVNIVYTTSKNHVCLLNCKHIVDRHDLRLIHWIGKFV